MGEWTAGLIAAVVLLVVSVAVNAALATRLGQSKRIEATTNHHESRISTVEREVAVVESRLTGLEEAVRTGFEQMRSLFKEARGS